MFSRARPDSQWGRASRGGTHGGIWTHVKVKTDQALQELRMLYGVTR